MVKKIIIFLLIFSSFAFAYDINNIKISSSRDKFKIVINSVNSEIKIDKNFYNYGINIYLKYFDFNKIFIKKINEKFLIKIIPIEKNRTLIKIQSLDKIDKNLFKIDKTKDSLIISYGFKPKPAINKNKSKEEEIIEKVTKSVFNKPPVTIKPEKEPERTTPLPIIDKSDFMNRMIKTYSLLALICIFLIGLAFVFKRVRNRNFFTPNKEFFKIIYRQNISPKKEIALIKVYDEYFLIGITEHNITLLSKIDSEDFKNNIKLIEGEKESKKFIKYIKEENEKITNNKDLLISSIEKKIRKYRDLIS